MGFVCWQAPCPKRAGRGVLRLFQEALEEAGEDVGEFGGGGFAGLEGGEIGLGLRFIEFCLGGLEHQPALLLFYLLEINYFGKEFGHVSSG